MTNEALADRLEANAAWVESSPMLMFPRAMAADLTEATRVIRESAAWTPATKKPASGRIVLATYLNDLGMPRIVRAAWVAENTEEAASDNDDFSVYCEADDTFYWPEGWYEQIDNWDDYSAVLINHKVTHWRPMPEVPADMAGETHD
jgi:hypothetical protein